MYQTVLSALSVAIKILRATHSVTLPPFYSCHSASQVGLMLDLLILNLPEHSGLVCCLHSSGCSNSFFWELHHLIHSLVSQELLISKDSTPFLAKFIFLSVFGLVFLDWTFLYCLNWLWIYDPLAPASLVAGITVSTTTTGCCMVILHLCFQFWKSSQDFVLGKILYISNPTFCCYLISSLFFFNNRVSLYSPDWLGTPYVA